MQGARLTSDRTWYYSAQQRRYIEPEETLFDDTIHEEEDEDDAIDPDEHAGTTVEDTTAKDNLRTATATAAQLEASQALRREERMAFAACAFAPLAGAYFLHIIRGQLSRAEVLVSDLNLTIFVMVAEIRPIMRLMKMQQERMFHLQRIVKSDPRDLLDSNDAEAIAQRLALLEGRLDGPPANNELEAARIAAEVRDSMQTQLDAIVRAIRKYEKKSIATSIQIEARFQEVDVRLQDSLSLAAAAARTGHRPGLISTFITWVISTVTSILRTMWDLALFPLRTVLAAAVEIKSYFVNNRGRQSRKRGKGQANGHSSIPTSRMQSRSMR